MALFRLYYTDGSTFDGERTQDWRRAPDGTGPEGGVQYVLLMQPGPTQTLSYDAQGKLIITNQWPALADRFAQGYVMRGYNQPYMIFTGVDLYGQLGSANERKVGQLIADEQYHGMFARVLADAAAGI